jgi:hypothetical protein
VDKWSTKTTDIQNIENGIGGVLRGLNNVKLNNVEQDVMKLREEVLGRLSDIQGGLEVRTAILRARILTYSFFYS